jgi:hypothetical protein
MKVRPLVMTDAERATIRRLVDHAARNVINRERLQRTIAGEAKPVGDEPEFTCVIPVGYRCVYSLEEQPLGICRHLSISVLGEGAAPNEAAVEMLATEFGFRGGLESMAHVWTEPVSAGKIAVNLLQTKDVKPSV